MKALKVLSFLLVCVVTHMSYGQDYTFDKKVTSKFLGHTRVFFFNSKDDSFFMEVSNREELVVSRIFDLKIKQQHYLYENPVDSQKLTYLKTDSLLSKVRNYTFEFVESKSDNDAETSEVIFKIFNAENKRIAKYKLTVKKADQSLFHLYKLSTLETLLGMEIKPPFNFIVLKAKGTNTHGNSTKYLLESIENINKTIKVPK